MKRISAIDAIRGLVMIIMALDHTREFMHVSSLSQSPTDLASTTPALFFTRWITHFCAPVFVFLSGTSAYLNLRKDNDLKKTRRFLFTRGLWLLFVEFTLVNFSLWFDPQFRVLIFEVIATIGFGLIILSLLLKLSPRIILITGLAIIFGHEGLQYLLSATKSTAALLLLSPNGIPVTPGFTFIMAYPPLPWLGIMLTGFGAGRFFEIDQQKRRKVFLAAGIAGLVLFFLIRYLNGYGDPAHWQIQKTGLYTALSFLNVSKYPPSLLFCLMTLALLCLLLCFMDGVKNRFTDTIAVYGKVPLFYFLVHLYVLHALLLAIILMQGFSWADLDFEASNFGRPKTWKGLELPGIYLVWIAVVVALYPLCKWYASYKSRNRDNVWLRYL